MRLIFGVILTNRCGVLFPVTISWILGELICWVVWESQWKKSSWKKSSKWNLSSFPFFSKSTKNRVDSEFLQWYSPSLTKDRVGCSKSVDKSFFEYLSPWFNILNGLIPFLSNIMNISWTYSSK